MRSVVLVTCALAAIAGGALAVAAPRQGKVVRVERGRMRGHGMPRICPVDPTVANRLASGFCYGPKPDLGERLLVVDTAHALATLRVTSVEPFGNCTPSMMWKFQAEFVTGDGTLPASEEEGLQALRDVDADPKLAHLMKKVEHVPGHRPVSANAVIGVDTDGDGTADLEFVIFPCDESNQPTDGPSPSSCVEAWVADMSDWQLALVDRLVTSCL